MKLNTKYHGVIDYNEDDVISFESGILGFEDLKKYIIFSLKDNEDFKIIHSIEDEGVGLVLMSPFLIRNDYEFELNENILKSLQIENESDVMVYTTVTLNSDLKKITTNLKAPIIINVCKNIGKQIIVDNKDYLVKEQIFKEN